MASIILLLLRDQVVRLNKEQIRCMKGLHCLNRFIVPHIAIIAKGNIIEGIKAKW